LASRLLTKILKKKSAKKGSSLSESDEDEVKNDVFMTQMRDKLETCSINSSSSKDASDYFEANTFRPAKPKEEDSSEGQYTAEMIIEIENRVGQLVATRALLDTGTTESIVLKHLVRKDRAKTEKGKPTVWNTLGGKFKTKRKALVEFKLPELSNSKTLTWLCHVDESSNKDWAIYDRMTEIGLSMITTEKCITWEQSLMPLKRQGAVQSRYIRHHMYALSVAAPVLKEAEERQSQILDADYSKVDIKQYVS
jgi:hypothetical protein